MIDLNPLLEEKKPAMMVRAALFLSAHWRPHSLLTRFPFFSSLSMRWPTTAKAPLLA